MSTDQTPAMIVIVGETASGKSALAMDIAQHYNGEIICADSWTVRREVHIGTAKPSVEDQALVKHHLLDIVNPDETFTAAAFKQLANQAINDIARRGKLPVMVGGTGLYVDGVLYDYSFLPASDTADRDQLNSMTNHELLRKIVEQGIELGDVDRHNNRRLIRLLETGGIAPTKQIMRANTLLLGIGTDREVMNQRITARVDDMLAHGLQKEVEMLVDSYDWNCEALKGVGYAQWRGYFLGDDSIAEIRAKIIKATKDLAKRQRTWFKRNKSIHWLSSPVKQREVDDLITTFLSV